MVTYTVSIFIVYNNKLMAFMRKIDVQDDPKEWYEFLEPLPNIPKPIDHLDCLLMRKDPPFNMDFAYTTHLLEVAENQGVFVVNKPRSIRDSNEKLFATWFPEACPETLVTKNIGELRTFLEQEGDIILKPLDGMGGSSIFRVRSLDPNIAVILENITESGDTKVMIQKYIPEIVEGDKRILLIDGVPMEGAIARVPAEGELRGNLAAGASAVARSLTTQDKWICDQVGPRLKELGLTLVGLDVIGDYLTEVNVTSPTCFREYKNLCDIDVASYFLDCLEKKLT